MNVCIGCDHGLNHHFQDVTGVVRCLVVDSGTSSSGVIGIAYSHQCDCADYQSELTNQRRGEEEAERLDREAWINDMKEKMQESHPELRTKR